MFVWLVAVAFHRTFNPAPKHWSTKHLPHAFPARKSYLAQLYMYFIRVSVSQLLNLIMEAVSIVALIGSDLAVATKTLKALNDLSQKNTNIKQSTQLLISKLSTIRVALSQLQALLQSDRAERFITPQLQSDLSSAMYPCTVVMGAIHQHVCQIQEGRLKGRIRYFWDEKAIREHSVHLDSQISALNLRLQVIQL